MSQEMRDLINKVKLFTNLINENLEDSRILKPEFFIDRVPFFKYFENESGGNHVNFSHYKNWQGENAAVLHFGNGKGFVQFPFLSVETKFHYYTIRQRDFESEKELTVFKPMFKTQHQFIYSTDIHMTIPKGQNVDELPNQIVSLMFKEVVKNELKFQESFTVKDADEMPTEKLDSIINKINKNCFKIEETLDKMNLVYFQ